MDPVGQGSFIPKQSMAAANRGSSMGILFLVALLMFIMSIIAAAGVFGYQQVLRGAISDKSKSLTADEGAFDAGTIQDLLRLDNRITQGKGLLQKHVAPSAIFGLLSSITLDRVQFTSFDMTLNKDGGAALILNGIADSFSSVALQSDQFSASSTPKALKDVVVSGVSVNETGKVSFTVTTTVDSTFLLYSNALKQSQSQVQTQTP